MTRICGTIVSNVPIFQLYCTCVKKVTTVLYLSKNFSTVLFCNGQKNFQPYYTGTAGTGTVGKDTFETMLGTFVLREPMLLVMRVCDLFISGPQMDLDTGPSNPGGHK
jgi:hypothetical protein